jgi:hypothetical protein
VAGLRQRAVGVVSAVLPDRFYRHYVAPLLIRRTQTPYDAKRFFESYHRALGTDDISDRQTISPSIDEALSRYHYNAVENSIIQYLAAHRPVPRPAVLDVGSGAGHWIDFYRDVFGAASVVGVEISGPDAAMLRRRYHGAGAVRIVEDDVAEPGFDLGERFDIVNAIGVMFHIVDDERWTRAVRNLATQLTEGGVLIVGGQFGRITRNVQFHDVDDYASFEELRAARSPSLLVNKRIRSRRRWEQAARAAGLEILGLERTQRHRDVFTVENNVLVLGRRRGASDGATVRVEAPPV